jgi:hypothetical protein
MVAPTPNLTLSVDLDDLPKNVREIHRQIVTPGTSGTMADNVQAMKDQLGTADLDEVAAHATDAATHASNAEAEGKAIRAAIGSPITGPIATTVEAMSAIIGNPAESGTLAANVRRTWQKIEQVDFATKLDITTLEAEIRELRSLICRCWWHDVCWVYLDRGATESAAAKVFDDIEFRDEARRADIASARFREVCQQHGIRDFVPDDRDFEKLLQLFTSFTARGPSQAGRQSRRTAGASRQSRRAAGASKRSRRTVRASKR